MQRRAFENFPQFSVVLVSRVENVKLSEFFDRICSPITYPSELNDISLELFTELDELKHLPEIVGLNHKI